MTPPDNYNYMEIICGKVAYDGYEGIIVDTIDKERYQQLFQSIQHSFPKLKPFTKCYREMIFRNTVFQIIKDTGAVTVFSLMPISYEVQNSTIQLYYEKKKLSILSFPSTKYYDSIHNIKKTTFRVSNRVYVNFEEYDDGSNYHVYMNYNHGINVDWDHVKKDIDTIVELFKK